MQTRTALIVGACQSAAEHLALLLARRDWQVVVIGQDETRLLALAQQAPERIDPLPMALDSRSNAERLAEVWGAEPVHVLAQFQPLALPKQITLAVQSITLMSHAFREGLRQATGLNLVALPRSRDPRDPLSQAAEGAHERALRALALKHEADGFRTVGLLATKTRGVAMAEVACDLATGRLTAGNGAVRGL